MKKWRSVLLIMFLALAVANCKDFLNVTPDKTGTIEEAFTQRSKAKKFLFSVYHYLPQFGYVHGNLAFLAGDEIWLNPKFRPTPYRIALGEQKTVNPYMNFWDGGGNTTDLYEGIRKSNVFLNNIDKVGNMTISEKHQWAAEVKFLKAYYYFYLIRMYGPVILNKNNLPVSAPDSKIHKARVPVDSCFAYVVKLLNEAIHTPELPVRIQNKQQDLGRVTKSMAFAVKAQVEVTAASPLFNGNASYKGYENVNGENPFNTKYDPVKWDSAAAAAKEAIDFAESNGFMMYNFSSAADLSDTTIQKLTIRNSVALGQGKERPNVIWSSPATPFGGNDDQPNCMPHGFDPGNPVNVNIQGRFSPPMEIAKMFYTNHGVPLSQDKTREIEDTSIMEGDFTSRYNIREGYKTAGLNFKREPRFYADLGFDGGIWYGSGWYDDSSPNNLIYIQGKEDQISGYTAGKNHGNYSSTGYWVKKLLNYNTTPPSGRLGINVNPYNWPQIRLAQLYLWYAEAKNEASGPGPEVYKYLNKIREHAGISTIQDSWDTYSNRPNQYKSKDGLREIIHRETLIEMAFEAKRFWYLRRWKEATDKLNKNITGWNVKESATEEYYKPTVIYKQSFTTKDYLWPISENNLNTNLKLTQNPGW